MAARQCPSCLTILPVTKISAYYNLVCSGCAKPLEISAFSRYLAAFVGLTVGALVWRVSTFHYADHPNALGWVLPILFAYLSLSVFQTLVLMAVADLRLKELIEPPQPAAAHHDHGSHAGHSSH